MTRVIARPPLGHRRKRARSAIAPCLVIAFTTACTGGDPAVPELEPRVAVHAVLDAQLREQVVFVERTQVATLERALHLVPGDAIATAGGLPISDATVVLFGPLDSVIAVEDKSLRQDGTGAGMYRVRTVTVVDGKPSSAAAGVLRLVPGERYRLEVRTATTTVTGSTRLPDVAPMADRTARVFNVDRDTLWMAQSARMQGATAFFLRQMHLGFSRSDRFSRTIDATLLAPPAVQAGSPSSAAAGAATQLSWAFAPSRDVTVPGTAQQFSVVAVDSNYLRYAVIGADPFGDDVRGNTLQGGVGLFGSVATLTDVTLDLVADREQPLEGEWVPVIAHPAMPARLQLYQSPRFPRADGRVVFTGTARYANGQSMFVEAVPDGKVFQMTFRSNSKSDAQLFRGELDGTTLTLFTGTNTIGLRYRLR